MVTVLTILGAIFALVTVPVATILGLVGFWIFGFLGALIGVFVGLVLQFGNVSFGETTPNVTIKKDNPVDPTLSPRLRQDDAERAKQNSK